MSSNDIRVFGFDSAWKDRPDAPGSICAIHLEGNRLKDYIAPTLAGFDQAFEQIQAFCAPNGINLIGFDQPTIVSNETGCRPVERAVGSLMSWLGGGVQPAYKRKIGMFDDAAPVWAFLQKLKATDDPLSARSQSRGLFIIEVFPALALASMNSAFCGRLCAPHYNPRRRATFTMASWKTVGETARTAALKFGLEPVANWCLDLLSVDRPQKSDQDKLDSIICMLVALSWRLSPRDEVAMIGDLVNGYMIAPLSAAVRGRLAIAARRFGVALV